MENLEDNCKHCTGNSGYPKEVFCEVRSLFEIKDNGEFENGCGLYSLREVENE